MHSQLMENLKRYGYEHPTVIQLAAISPTGAGKTSYLLPVLTFLNSPILSSTAAGKGIRAVILAPTRELAHQIYNECFSR
jgi:ATP-dependent RNA helicase DDX52/ROK1